MAQLLQIEHGERRGSEGGGGEGELVLTDVPEALPLLQQNARSAGLKRWRALPLSWSRHAAASLLRDLGEEDRGAPGDAEAAEGRKADLIVVADCLYINEAAPALAETIDELLHPSGLCVVGYGRNRCALRIFLEKVNDLGLRVEEVGQEGFDAEYSAPDLSAILLRKR